MQILNNKQDNIYEHLKKKAKDITSLHIYSAYASDSGIVKLFALRDENNFELTINVANRDFLDKQEIKFITNVGDEDEWTVRFHDWIKSIKALTNNNQIEFFEMQDSDFHGKCYFITYKNAPDEAIVGSANATNIGMSGTTNNEISIVTNFSKAKLIPDIVDERKTKLQERIKIDRYILSPQGFYQNTLKQIYKNQDRTITYWEDFETKSAFKSLRKAQKDAFRICVERMDNVGPIFVSYATGFGKTRLYIALFCYYNFNKIKKRNVVVVGPKKLKDHIDNEAYKMLNATEYQEFTHLFADSFVSYDQPRETSNSESVWNAKEWKATLKRGDVFIFEEAHNLRNTKSQRYQNIHEQLKNNPASICYVTATPIVKRYSEILNLLKICEQREQSSNFQEKLDHVNKLRMAVNTNSDDFVADLKQFNSEFILSGQKIDRKRNTIEDYPMFEIDRIFYNYADRYHYFREFYNDKENYLLSPGIGNHLSKWMLLQLLDSSSEAFLNSSTKKIEWMKRINTREELEKELNKDYETIDFVEAQGVFEEGDEIDKNLIVEELLSKESAVKKSKITDYEFNKWLKQKPTTIKKLEEMQEIAQVDGGYMHNKFAKLELRLNEIFNTKGKNAAILIFVNFKESSNTLYEKITSNSKFSDWNVDVVAQSNTKIMEQISKFNSKNSDDKINILIATPLFSEGFDLYNGTDIINYDLTWNPTDLIQRIGRIYRFTTDEARKNETIKIHNCYCEDPKFIKTITYELRNDEKIDQIDMIAPEFNVKAFFDDDFELAHEKMLEAFSTSFDQNYLHEYLSIDEKTKQSLDNIVKPTITYWQTNYLSEGIYFLVSVRKKFQIVSINPKTKEIVLDNSEKFHDLQKTGILSQNASTFPTINWLQEFNDDLFSAEDIYEIFYELKKDHREKNRKHISMEEFKIHSALIAGRENE